jgi:CheY-like chemotaxis protein
MCELSVLIVDDSAVFRKAAQDLIASLHGVASVECASSGAEALTRAAELRPDLVLMDIMMFGMNGLEAIRVLRDRVPALRMYAVTLHDCPEFRAAALKNGAAGLIPKHEFAKKISELIAQLACDEGTVLSGCGGPPALLVAADRGLVPDKGVPVAANNFTDREHPGGGGVEAHTVQRFKDHIVTEFVSAVAAAIGIPPATDTGAY